MNAIKKIGLTALASSLVVTSAVAGEMSVSGGASNRKGTSQWSGRCFRGNNQIHQHHLRKRTAGVPWRSGIGAPYSSSDPLERHHDGVAGVQKKSGIRRAHGLVPIGGHVL